MRHVTNAKRSQNLCANLHRSKTSHNRRRRGKTLRHDRVRKKRWIHTTVSRDVSCEITTRHTSLAAAKVVAPELDGVVAGGVFLGSALLAVLPLQLLERPVPPFVIELPILADPPQQALARCAWRRVHRGHGSAAASSGAPRKPSLCARN